MAILSFIGKVTGTKALGRKLTAYTASFATIFGGNRLENLLLERTKERFEPKGSNPNAQRSPFGDYWLPLSPETNRKTNTNTSQLLVDSGQLRDAITIVRGNMRQAAIESPGGGGFTIGVLSSSSAADYAALHQFGGFAGKNNKVFIPARPFLGISKQDSIAVDNVMVRVLKGFGIGVS